MGHPEARSQELCPHLPLVQKGPKYLSHVRLLSQAYYRRMNCKKSSSQDSNWCLTCAPVHWGVLMSRKAKHCQELSGIRKRASGGFPKTLKIPTSYQHLGLGCFCAMGEHVSLILCPPVTNSWLNAWKNTTHKLEKVKWKVDLKMHSTESLVTKKLRGTGKQHRDPSPGTSECPIPQPASLVPLLIYFHLLRE